MTTAATPPDPTNTVTPLDGEPGIPSVAQRTRQRLDWKGISASALAVLTLAVVATVWFNRAFNAGDADKDAAAQKRRLSATPRTDERSPPARKSV